MTEKFIESPLISNDLFRVIAESSHDLIAITNNQAQPIWANKSWESVFGSINNEKDFLERIHTDDLSKVKNAWSSLVDENENIDNLTYRYEATDASWLHLETNASVKEVSGNKLVYVYARDITKETEYKDSLVEKNAANKKLLDEMVQRELVMKKMKMDLRGSEE
jgi:PAS domain S-box-containing protein